MDEAWQFFHQSKVNVKSLIFLEAWKQGINKAGSEFFDIKADTVDAATDKLQLQPNFKFIKEAIGGFSHGKQVLLGLMYSFIIPKTVKNFWNNRIPLTLLMRSTCWMMKDEKSYHNCG
ncbi:MAG: hypothetical protein Q8M40_01310 [Legionella sp.]|nr:hypothetical protein [Legionella sp.]